MRRNASRCMSRRRAGSLEEGIYSAWCKWRWGSSPNGPRPGGQGPSRAHSSLQWGYRFPRIARSHGWTPEILSARECSGACSLSGFGGHGGCFDRVSLVGRGDQVGRVSCLGLEDQVGRVGHDEEAALVARPQPPKGLRELQIAPRGAGSRRRSGTAAWLGPAQAPRTSMYTVYSRIPGTHGHRLSKED